MARRKISNRGRVLAAALCVGATGVLAGLMAATDDTGPASAGTSARAVDPTSQPGVGSSPSDGSSATDGNGQPSFPQPNTRSGGS